MLFNTRQRLLTIALAGAFGSLLIAHQPQAWAQAAAAPVDINVAAQPLSSALAALSSQTGVQVFAAGNLVAGKSAPAVSGKLTPQQALEKLLAGSGLQAQASGNGNLTVHPGPVEGADHTLPEVKVRAPAFQEEATGPVSGFVARRSQTGTKTDTPLIEVPQSISVIGRNELDARGAQSVMEALRYVPGVAVDTYGVETRGTEWLLIRGFNAMGTNNLVDGLRMGQSTQVAFWTETYGLERIEVLRGPASVTYGQVEAGGTINRVSKRPTSDAVREIELQTGSFGRKQAAADFGGALNSDGTLLYRLVGLALDTENQIQYKNGDRATNKRQFLAPSLTWKPSASTQVTLLGQVQHDVATGFSFNVVRANGENTGVLRGDPKYLRYGQNQRWLGYEAEHSFNDNWTVRQKYRHAEATLDNRLINPGSLGLVGDIYDRNARRQLDKVSQDIVDTHVQGRFKHGDIEHTVLAGLDWTSIETDFKQFKAINGTTPTLNLSAPVYGVPMPATPEALSNQAVESKQIGFYLQDQVKLDQRWVVTLGGRQDKAKKQSINRMPSGVTTHQTDEAFSGRAGLTYLADGGVAPYVSYAESFMPQTIQLGDGSLSDPATAKQWELGVKYQPSGSETLLTAAWFDLTKGNVVTNDLATSKNVQTGEVRSKGLELEAKTRVVRNVYLHGAYSYNAVKITKSRNTDLGKTPIQVPRQMASLGLDWSLTGALEGFSVGAGTRYVGKQFDNLANTQTTRSYTLVDAAVRYGQGPWSVALNVANLFDKEYVASHASGYFPGAERTFTLTAKYRF